MTTKPILLDLPMPIYTPRLQLRPRRLGEGRVIAQAVDESREHLKPFMPFAREVRTPESYEEHCRESMAKFISRTDLTLSIYDRAGETFLGSTGLHRANWDVPSFHIGYWVHVAHEGKGYVQESTNALTRYAFEVLRARRVEIRCNRRNSRSLAVMTKLGFQQEGILRNDDLGAEGELRDTIVTSRIDLHGLPPLEVSW
jgi:RimJ/RimL family protein N-acetyltransferase